MTTPDNTPAEVFVVLDRHDFPVEVGTTPNITYIPENEMERNLDAPYRVVRYALAESSGWLPIESAPKDGTRILLLWGSKVVTGFWLDNSLTPVSWKGWTMEGMHPRRAGEKATHWQSLPPGPTP